MTNFLSHSQLANLAPSIFAEKPALRGHSESGRRTRTRAVTSVSEDIRLNKALWTMAQALARRKTSQVLVLSAYLT